jgi:hypothetical protein
MNVTYYHIVQNWAVDVKGSSYAAPKPACFTGVFLADMNPFPATVGNSQTGVTVDYDSCLSGTVHIQTMIFFTQATTPSCCRWSVVPHPGASSGRIEVRDCDDQVMYGYQWTAVINANPSCWSACCGPPTPVEETTWGRVNALYDE